MRYKILFLLIIFCGFCLKSQAQAEIKFEETTFDFGEITEGEQATHTFRFTNTGKQELIISNVRASCGCTTPNWTKAPVAPGETGIIKASYNSRNRPGHFNKSITIRANTKQGTHVLYIKGKVIREASHSNVQPNKAALENSPKAVITKKTLKAGQVQKGQKISLSLEIKNEGKNPLLLKHLSSACNCIRLNNYPPASIAEGQTQTFELLYQPQKEGKHKETVFLHTNDLTQPKISFTLEAEVKENLANESMLKEKKSVFDF
jgi:hypothetical protein